MGGVMKCAIHYTQMFILLEIKLFAILFLALICLDFVSVFVN